MAAKRGTLPGDVVLVHYQGKPASFARVEAIRPHGRPGWHLCDLLVLAVPAQPVTWILERAQIDGVEFTMGGQPVRLERLPELGALHETARATGAQEPVDANPDAEAAAPPREGGAKGGRASKSGGARRTPAERAGNVVRLFPRK